MIPATLQSDSWQSSQYWPIMVMTGQTVRKFEYCHWGKRLIFNHVFHGKSWPGAMQKSALTSTSKNPSWWGPHVILKLQSEQSCLVSPKVKSATKFPGYDVWPPCLTAKNSKRNSISIHPLFLSSTSQSMPHNSISFPYQASCRSRRFTFTVSKIENIWTYEL